MTEQSPNDQFHASSFMQGHNAEYLEQLYARFADDPSTVDGARHGACRGMGQAGAVVAGGKGGADDEIEAMTKAIG
ncbi:MAG: hypothetical protein AAF484_10680 [Pseudomonadota bacterium]